MVGQGCNQGSELLAQVTALLGQDPPPGNMVVGKTQSLNLEASVPHGLLAGAHASPRDRSSSPSGHVCRQSSSSCRWHVTTFPHFIPSKHVTGSSPHSRGGHHTRTYTPRGRTPGNHPRRLPTTHPRVSTAEEALGTQAHDDALRGFSQHPSPAPQDLFMDERKVSMVIRMPFMGSATHAPPHQG